MPQLAKFLNGQHRVGADADEGAIDETDVNVSVGRCFDDVALLNEVAFGGNQTGTGRAFDFGLADDEGDFADTACGPCRLHQDRDQGGQ